MNMAGFIEWATSLVNTYGIAYILSAARMLGFTQMFPLFTWSQLPQSLKTTISFVLATPMAIALAEQMPLYQGNSFNILILLVKEFGIGAFLGLAMALPFIGAQAAGDTIDFYRGASQSNLSDPVNSAETTISGIMFLLLSLVFFLNSGGMAMALDLVYKSYELWPVLQLTPKVSADAFILLASGLVVLLRLALLIAAPMMIILALADLFLIFVSKGYRQLQIFELSNSFKNGLYMIFMPMYLLFFWSNIEKEVYNAFIAIKELLKNFFL